MVINNVFIACNEPKSTFIASTPTRIANEKIKKKEMQASNNRDAMFKKSHWSDHKKPN
jgi:hypothetical protein